MTERRVYLDYNATTPVADEAIEAMVASAKSAWGNPSSGHWAGAQAKGCVEDARASVAASLGCSPAEVLLTSGGTESNNIAIIGTIQPGAGKHIVTTDIEHPAVMNVVKALQADRGFEITFVKTGPTGVVQAAEVEAAVRPGATSLITVMHANNETGAVQPIAEISKVAKKHGILFHTDASQSIGKVPSDVHSLGADLLTVCSHKFYGPKGVGALYIKDGSVPALHPLFFGANHERGLRPGTESSVLVCGMAAALKTAVGDLPARAAHMREKRDLLLAELQKHFDVEVNGDLATILPNTLNCSLKQKGSGVYVSSASVISQVSSTVAVSAGSACHSGEAVMSYVHAALGLTCQRAAAALRIRYAFPTATQS